MFFKGVKSPLAPNFGGHTYTLRLFLLLVSIAIVVHEN
jgi:hypothetical protein